MEQPLQCAKCGQITVHRSVSGVMKCNVCEPAPARENLHTWIWIATTILIVGASLAVCTR